MAKKKAGGKFAWEPGELKEVKPAGKPKPKKGGKSKGK